MKNSSKNFILKLSNKFILPVALIIIILLFGGIFLFLTRSSNQSEPKSISIGLPKSPQVALAPIRNQKSRNPDIKARRYGLLDVDSGTMMYGQNLDDRVPIASITKVMTAIVTLDKLDLDEVVIVSKDAASTIGSVVLLRPGEKITVISLLNGLLIHSGNDCAYALAEYYGSKINPNATFEEKIALFIEEMNKNASNIGLKETKYLDPAGLDDNGTSTVRDQGILVAYALRNKVFTDIIHKPNLVITSLDGSIIHKLDNSNRLVKEEMLYPGIIGGKTGFTPIAGHNLVTAAERGNHRIVAVIFSTYDIVNTAASAIEARKLLDWGFNNFTWKNIY